MKPPPGINGIPLLGQREQQAKAQIHAAISQLAMQIYAQAATAHVTTKDYHQSVNMEALRSAAKDSLQAAQCYFEAIGVIEVAKEKDND